MKKALWGLKPSKNVLQNKFSRVKLLTDFLVSSCKERIPIMFLKLITDNGSAASWYSLFPTTTQLTCMTPITSLDTLLWKCFFNPNIFRSDTDPGICVKSSVQMTLCKTGRFTLHPEKIKLLGAAFLFFPNFQKKCWSFKKWHQLNHKNYHKYQNLLQSFRTCAFQTIYNSFKNLFIYKRFDVFLIERISLPVCISFPSANICVCIKHNIPKSS